jgi:hypothetical protein
MILSFNVYMLCSSIIFDIPDSTDILGFQYFRKNLLGEFSKLKTALSAESMSVELALLHTISDTFFIEVHSNEVRSKTLHSLKIL